MILEFAPLLAPGTEFAIGHCVKDEIVTTDTDVVVGVGPVAPSGP